MGTSLLLVHPPLSATLFLPLFFIRFLSHSLSLYSLPLSVCFSVVTFSILSVACVLDGARRVRHKYVHSERTKIYYATSIIRYRFLKTCFLHPRFSFLPLFLARWLLVIYQSTSPSIEEESCETLTVFDLLILRSTPFPLSRGSSRSDCPLSLSPMDTWVDQFFIFRLTWLWTRFVLYFCPFRTLNSSIRSSFAHSNESGRKKGLNMRVNYSKMKGACESPKVKRFNRRPDVESSFDCNFSKWMCDSISQRRIDLLSGSIQTTAGSS